MKKRYLTTVFLLLFSITGCKENEQLNLNTSVISIDKNIVETDFDKFLDREYRQPYNIEFNYKMINSDTDMNYTLVPATYKNSVKMANLLKYVCLDAYDAVAPEGFLKKYFPKRISLIGSAGYRNNGTKVLGTAEGGLEITLYDINNLKPNNISKMFEFYFRTIFHEFSHIMHQKIEYTADFKSVTPTEYLAGSWKDVSYSEALKKGFISAYSRKEFNEDFVELLAHYVTYSQTEWDAVLTDAGTEGAQKITQKMNYVKAYMLETWDVDLDKLRNEVLTRAQNVPNIDLTNIN